MRNTCCLVAMANNFDSSVLEGNIKFREKKTWKRRWCVVRRLSPVANSLIMHLYKKPYSNSAKGVQSKASLNLEHLLGMESCFLLQKESLTLAIICKALVAVLAFDNRETLLEWQAQISDILGHGERYEVQLLSIPPKFEITSGSAVLHIRDWQFSLTQGIPARLIGSWNMADLRRFGAVDDRRFCFEGGSRCSVKGAEGVFVLGSSRSHEIANKFEYAVRGRLSDSLRVRIHHPSTLSGLLTPMTRHRMSTNSRFNSQSLSKPCTPLLSGQRRAAEFCLSPPCARHTRSASQQHSRNSSISSGTRLSSISAGMHQHQSDPELLYDKPRSLNAAMTQAIYETPSNEIGQVSRQELPTDHYDTPRRILKQLTTTFDYRNGANIGPPYEIKLPDGMNSTNTLYATVTKPKKVKVKPTETEVYSAESSGVASKEIQDYLVMQRSHGQWTGQEDYVEMHALPCSPATLLHRERCLAPAEQCSGVCCNGVRRRVSEVDYNKFGKLPNGIYQNSVWLQLQAEDMSSCYQKAKHTRCLYSKQSCYPHGTLPMPHNRTSGAQTSVYLRRSASMPAACRQGNRDSSDSTDSGVSVTADAVSAPPIGGPGCIYHHHNHPFLSRHWSLPRPVFAGDSAQTNPKTWPDASIQTKVVSNPITTLPTHSNSSSLSNILDQLETMSVASVGYETCV